MNILFFSHWFPPYNEIGSVRPYQLARFLAEAGHKVTVFTSSGNWSPQTFEADTSKFEVVRVEIPKVVKYTDSPNGGVLNRLVKRLFYPDQFSLMKRELIEAVNARAPNNVDLIISSALPFSVHVVARYFSKKLNVPWIADNRDLWASTPYRRQLLGSQYFDLLYEKHILNPSKACVVVGEGMARDLRLRLPGKRVEVMMNGADCTPTEHRYSDYNLEDISLVYTGTLYKGRRDLSPLLQSLSEISINSVVKFYGAENEYIDSWSARFPSVNVLNCGRVGKSEIKAVQRAAHFLILALGVEPFEKYVLPGKFFEYVESGRPIIAICDKGSELALLIERFDLGCASRDVGEISKFIMSVVEGNKWSGGIPLELTRRFQIEKVLPSLIKEVCG